MLPHAPREQRLPQHVVDLVRTRVREVLALEEDAQAQAFRESVTLGDGCGPARVRGEQFSELGAECVVVPRGAELALEVG